MVYWNELVERLVMMFRCGGVVILVISIEFLFGLILLSGIWIGMFELVKMCVICGSGIGGWLVFVL